MQFFFEKRGGLRPDRNKELATRNQGLVFNKLVWKIFQLTPYPGGANSLLRSGLILPRPLRESLFFWGITSPKTKMEEFFLQFVGLRNSRREILLLVKLSDAFCRPIVQKRIFLIPYFNM